MNLTFNDRIRQILLLILILGMGILIMNQLYVFLPGLLGGVTLYILTGSLFKKLVYDRKWKKGLTALLFIVVFLVLISIPIYLTIELLSPKINQIISNPEHILESLKVFIAKVETSSGIKILSEENAKSISKNISAFVPTLLTSTINIITNLIILLFIYYYLLIDGKEIEKNLDKFIPLKPANINSLAIETKSMIKANALGIPAICFVQGVFAAIGFWIFGVQDWGMWGFFTGLFAFFPFIGTMAIWVPIVISIFISGDNSTAIGLTLYSLIITGNVDYLTRLLLMKKLVNVHPMITIFGVIVGLGLFGFMGIIFGPLLLSYLIVFVKIYINEFTEMR